MADGDGSVAVDVSEFVGKAAEEGIVEDVEADAVAVPATGAWAAACE